MKITVYTVIDCQFSKQEKEYLNSHKLQFEEKNLETNKEFLTEMLAVSDNFAGTPVTRLEKDDGQIQVLKGFTQSEFDEALGFAPSAPSKETGDAAQMEAVSPASTPVTNQLDVNTPSPAPTAPAPTPPPQTPEPQNPTVPEPPIVPVVEPPPQSTSPIPSTPQISQTQPVNQPDTPPTPIQPQDERLTSVLDNLQSMSSSPSSTPNEVTTASPASPNMPSVPDLKLG